MGDQVVCRFAADGGAVVLAPATSTGPARLLVTTADLPPVSFAHGRHGQFGGLLEHAEPRPIGVALEPTERYELACWLLEQTLGDEWPAVHDHLLGTEWYREEMRARHYEQMAEQAKGER